ncbi:MAG TPA: hypothetical protein VIS96_13915 [Terrimicrobiaceae bacterium]
MWKVVITEIQDANALDPENAPAGAFFVNTERFARTVENLDLPRLINVIDRMQCSPSERRREHGIPDEKTPYRGINRLAELGLAYLKVRRRSKPSGSINFANPQTDL